MVMTAELDDDQETFCSVTLYSAISSMIKALALDKPEM
jgi:hypothetical protein